MYGMCQLYDDLFYGASRRVFPYPLSHSDTTKLLSKLPQRYPYGGVSPV